MNEQECQAQIASLTQSVKRINQALYVLAKAKFEPDESQMPGESPRMVLINQRALFSEQKQKCISFLNI